LKVRGSKNGWESWCSGEGGIWKERGFKYLLPSTAAAAATRARDT
jgi:hypothetical protein